MSKLLLRIFFAGLVFLAVFLLYSQVSSHSVAIGIAVAVALAELAGSLAVGGSQGGAGSGLRLMFWLGAPVLAWPVGAIGLEWLVPALSRPEAVSGAAIVAALTALVPDATGVWLILGRGALLGLLHHAFGPRRPKIAQPYIEAMDWRTGTLPRPTPANPVPDPTQDRAPTPVLTLDEPSPLDDLTNQPDAPDRAEPDTNLDTEWRE